MIKYLFMDVDGTLTDGSIIVGEDGEVFKSFNVKDGYGIHIILPSKGIVPVIFTGRKSIIVEKRCQELEIKEVYQGVKSKLTQLNVFLDEHEIKMNQVAYIGDDVNDLEAMCAVKESGGLVGCPQDATKELKKIANFVSSKDGGRGAVREFIEYIISRNF